MEPPNHLTQFFSILSHPSSLSCPIHLSSHGEENVVPLTIVEFENVFIDTHLLNADVHDKELEKMIPD